MKRMKIGGREIAALVQIFILLKVKKNEKPYI